MNCPVCKDVKLVISERQGIEIDYCPECRGVWLDRGELDKIIEKSIPAEAPSREREEPSREREDRYYKDDKYENRDRHYDDDYYKRDSYNKYGPHKKKRGFLGDIFDFD